MSSKAKAAFIDRDGVINEERNYVHRIEDFVLLPGVAQGLIQLREAGFLLIVVTNQAGIARGYYSQNDLNQLHEHFREQLALYDITLDAIYFCPHHPQGNVKELAIKCECRKPSPGMLLQAAKDFNLDLSRSILIGDKLTDLQAGQRAGVGRTVIVESGRFVEPSVRLVADFAALDLLAAAQLLTTR